MINSNSVVKRKNDAIMTELEDAIVIMSIEKSSYYALDEIASLIWVELENPVQVSELIEGFLDKYEVSPEQCQEDVISFLEELRKKELIEVISSNS